MSPAGSSTGDSGKGKEVCSLALHSVCPTFHLQEEAQHRAAQCTDRIKRKAGRGRRGPNPASPYSLEIYRQKWYIASGLCRESGVAPTLVVGEVGHATFTLSLCPLFRGH